MTRIFWSAIILLLGAASAAAQTKTTTQAFGYGATVEVSSYLKPAKTLTYGVDNLIDQDPKTAWIEGKKGFGEGEHITITFAKPVPIFGIKFIPGYAKSKSTLTQNAMPKFKIVWGEIEMQVDYPVLEYNYKFAPSGPFAGEPYKVVSDQPEHYNFRYVVLPTPTMAKSVRIEITGSLSELGVAADAGFSELAVITDQVLDYDDAAKAIIELHAKTAFPAKTKLVKPSLSDCNLVHSAAQKKLFAAMTPKDLLAIIQKAIDREKSPHRTPDPVFTHRSGSNFSLIFATNTTEACSSDGEGGTYYLPKLNYINKSLHTVDFLARDHPVP